jgi:hypothetical protein
MPTPHPFLKVAGFFAGAIAVGALLAFIATTAGRGLAGATYPPATSTPVVSAVAATTADPTPSPTQRAGSPTPSATSTPIATASPGPTPEPITAGLPEGCFADGFIREGDWTDPIVADGLLRRLPVPHWSSEPQALVGSSANSLFVSAFAECTGADPAAIRWGSVNGGLIGGTFPQAIQVDGYTGPQLAQILVEGYLHPQQREALEEGQHAGWTYLHLDQTFAVTASADTVYWYWVWPCCYEGPLFSDQSFAEVVETYLDLTNDEPVAWP